MPTTAAHPEPHESIQSTAADVGDAVDDEHANVDGDAIKPQHSHNCVNDVGAK